jgi:hypothetical protein
LSASHDVFHWIPAFAGMTRSESVADKEKKPIAAVRGRELSAIGTAKLKA